MISVYVRGALLAALTLTVSASPAMADTAETSDLTQQTDVAVTIYNNNLALVRDRRTLNLPTGEVALRFMGVAEHVQPQTVSLKSLSRAGSLRILEQNYEYDLMSPQKLMEKYVGKAVRLVNLDERQAFSVVDATLLSLNNGPVYQVDDDIYLGHPGNVVLPEVPEELMAEPTLVWQLENGMAQQQVEATYLTGGMGWQADYVLTYDEDAGKMNLEGWVTLTNNSGIAYQNASLKVVAGDVNRVSPGGFGGGGFGGGQLEALGYMADAVMEQESFAEYHLYTLPRRTTIKQNQSKQVSLLTANNVGIEKRYEYRGQVHFYAQRMGEQPEQNADTFLVFQNEEDNELGVPLPGGVMRVYQADSGGMLQFAGEDRIDHTAKDEEVRLRLGSAFDLVCERKQLDYTALPGNDHESEFEITLRNHKDADVVIDVVEPMPGDWKILSSSQEYEKRDAATAVFSVPVPGNGEAVVRYRVRVHY